MTKNPYKDWPEEQLAAELFAMRRAVQAHPDEAHRWIDRITQIEKEANSRRLENTPLKTFQEPFGEILARRFLAALWKGGREPEYVDPSEALYVAEDEYGWLWVRTRNRPSYERIKPWRPRHALAIVNSMSSRKIVMVEWE